MRRRKGKSTWLPIAGLALATAALSTGAEAASKDWVKLASPDGRFSIACPAAPTHKAWQETDVETPRTVHVYRCADAAVTVVVAYADYPAGTKVDSDAELTANRDTFLQRIEATQVSSKPFIYQPVPTKMLPALEVEATNANRNFRSVGIVDGERVYQVAVGAPNDPASAIKMQEVLRSFQLTSAAQ